MPIATVPKLRGAAGDTVNPPVTTVPVMVVEPDPLTPLPRLALTVSLAPVEPVALGAVNVTITTHVFPGPGAAGIAAPSVHVVPAGTMAKLDASPSLKERLVMVNGPLPELVTVTACGELVVPGNCVIVKLDTAIAPCVTPLP